MKKLSLVLILAASVSACSHYSQAEKQQRSYEKYVRKSISTREKQQKRFAKSHPAPPAIPEREVGPWNATATTTATAEGPMSVTDGESN